MAPSKRRSRFLALAFASPVSIRLVSPTGKVVDTATGQNDFEDSIMIVDDELKLVLVPEPEEGVQIFTVTGTGSGTYHGLVLFADDEGVTGQEIPETLIEKGEFVRYRVDVKESSNDPMPLYAPVVKAQAEEAAPVAEASEAPQPESAPEVAGVVTEQPPSTESKTTGFAWYVWVLSVSGGFVFGVLLRKYRG